MIGWFIQALQCTDALLNRPYMMTTIVKWAHLRGALDGCIEDCDNLCFVPLGDTGSLHLSIHTQWRLPLCPLWLRLQVLCFLSIIRYTNLERRHTCCKVHQTRLPNPHISHHAQRKHCRPVAPHIFHFPGDVEAMVVKDNSDRKDCNSLFPASI